MNTKHIAHAVLLAGSVFSVVAAHAADDRTIASGEAATLSSNAVYGNLTVNGSLTLAENTVVTTATLKCAIDATDPEGQLILKSGAKLVTTNAWTMNGSGVFRTRFEGGTISFQQIKRFDAGTNVFEAVDGNDINLHIYGSKTPLIYYTNNTPRVLFTGNGGLVKTGANQTLMNDYHYNKVIVMDYTGDTWIKEGIAQLQGCNFPAKTAMHISRNAALCLNGNRVCLGSIDGEGFVYDAPNNLSVNVFAGDGDSNLTAFDTYRACIEKSGSGTMTVAPRGSMGYLNVNQGKVIVQGRAEAGYRTYRFKIDEGRGPGSNWDATQFGELYLFNDAGEDVVNLRSSDRRTSYNDGAIECLFDRKAKTKWYSAVKYNSSDSAKAACYVNVTFPVLQQVSSYLWGTAWDCSGRDPSAWRLQGCLWQSSQYDTLATVTNFSANSTRDADASPTNFVMNAPRRVTIPRVSVANGTTLEVDGKSELYTTNLANATYCRVNLTNGGTLILDPQVDQTNKFLRLGGNGELRKEGARSLTLFGAATSLTGPIHVAGGTLKLTSDHVVPPKAFKFTFTKSRWMAQHPGEDCTAKDERHTIQFGELGLYDENFNRISLTANIAYCNGKSSAGSLFDNDPKTPCYDLGLPTTPYEVIFELKEGVATSVASYRFHPETQWGGVPDKVPAEWTVSVAETRDGPWTVVDQRFFITDNWWSGWNSYQSGEPFTFTNMQNAAFASTCPVQVDAGATLDVSDSATTFANLKVDCAANGTGRLVGGALAETGTVTLLNVPEKAKEVFLPLTFEGTTIPATLGGWSIVVDGQVKKGGFLIARDGQLVAVLNGGGLLIVR